MSKLDAQRLRDYLVLDQHEVTPPPHALPVFKPCTVRKPLGAWEQGIVSGYLEVRNEVHAVVTYTERPDEGGVPQFDILKLDRVRPFRKIVEREFRL